MQLELREEVQRYLDRGCVIVSRNPIVMDVAEATPITIDYTQFCY